jgi:hypothetical protein
VSEQVQAIVEAVRSLDPEQRRELTSALAAIDDSMPSVSGDRRHLVDSIRGKYRHVPTSSESFVDRKLAEIALESRP